MKLIRFGETGREKPDVLLAGATFNRPVLRWSHPNETRSPRLKPNAASPTCVSRRLPVERSALCASVCIQL
jgi:hypothetical protein